MDTAAELLGQGDEELLLPDLAIICARFDSISIQPTTPPVVVGPLALFFTLALAPPWKHLAI